MRRKHVDETLGDGQVSGRAGGEGEVSFQAGDGDGGDGVGDGETQSGRRMTVRVGGRQERNAEE